MSKVAVRAPKVAGKKGAKKGGKKAKKSFKSYISKVLKAASKKKLSMSTKTAAIMESFVKHQIDTIATEASALARGVGRKTLTSGDIQTAVRLILPTDLGKTCVAEATRAMAQLTA